MITFTYYKLSGSHVTLEALLKDQELKTAIKDLVRGSGRAYPRDHEETLAASDQRNQSPALTSTKVQPNGGVSQKETIAVL